MHIFEVSLFGIHIAPTWYGLMYALGFIICYTFVKKWYIFRQKDHIDTLLFFVFLGVVLGGRLWYVLLYHPDWIVSNPFSILRIWEGGMSFHGGFLGTVLAVYIFAMRYYYEFWSLIDTLAIIIATALGLWRLGNYINGELPWYAPYDGILPMTIQWVSHFPSPLLELLLEGVILFIVMLIAWRYSKKWKTQDGFLSGVFLIGYALSRLIAEQFRLPDTHIWYLWGTDWLTLGIVYTVPMLLFWVYLIATQYKTKKILDNRSKNL